MRCMTSSALIYSPEVNEIPLQRNGVTGASPTTKALKCEFCDLRSFRLQQERNVFLLDKVHLTNLEKFSWLFVAIWWKNLTIDWNDLTMERNDRIPDTNLTRKKLSVVIVIHNNLLPKVSHNENREL